MVRKHPAETSSGAGAVALVVAYLLGVDDPEALVALGAALGLIPAAVTLLVANGGVRGVARLLWRGRA